MKRGIQDGLRGLRAKPGWNPSRFQRESYEARLRNTVEHDPLDRLGTKLPALPSLPGTARKHGGYRSALQETSGTRHGNVGTTASPQSAIEQHNRDMPRRALARCIHPNVVINDT